MNRLRKAIMTLGLVGLLSSPLLAEEAKKEQPKSSTSLVEQCKTHKPYVPKPEIKAKYDALEQKYNTDCHEKKQCQESIQELEKIIQQDPKFADAYHRLGTAFIETKEYEKAIPYLEKAVQLDACNAEIYRNLKIAHAIVGVTKKDKNLINLAISEAEKVCQLSPGTKLCEEAQITIKNLKPYLNQQSL